MPIFSDWAGRPLWPYTGTVTAAPLAPARRAALPALLCLIALAGPGCRRLPPPAADVVATVNGQPIAGVELDRLFARQTAGTTAPLSPDQRMALRLSLLNQLVDRHILLQYAASVGITADPTAVQRAADLDRTRDPGLDPGLARQEAGETVVLNELMRREVADKVHVSDADIAAFYQRNQASFHLPEPQYHVLEIVVTPHPGAVTNLAEDKAATPAAARKKIEQLRQRLEPTGKAPKADFATLAQQYSEDPATASSGGDMGLIPQSVLMQQIPAPLRAAILALHPGEVSPVISTPQGYYLLKLLAVEPAGLRPLTDPQVRQSIRDLLASSRQQVIQEAFLTSVRDQAKVVNYLAQTVLDGTAPPSP